MPKIAACVAALALILLCSIRPAVAQALPEPQTQGDVTFVSGGVAEDSQQAMFAVRQDYNLHLLFAKAVAGNYFAMVPVRITDASGTVVLNTTSEGPYLYARLKPGKYTVLAAHRGVPMSKTANVPEKGAVDLNFYWEF